MKKARLVFNRIKQYGSRNKTVFVLFVIGTALNAIMFIYLYGNLRPILANWNSDDSYYRQYSVFLDVDWDATEEDGFAVLNPPLRDCLPDEVLERIQDSDLFETIELHSIYQERDINDSMMIPIGAYVLGKPDPSEIINGVAYLSSDDEIIVDPYSQRSVGKKLNVRGTEFNVVGMSSGEASYIVTEKAYRILGANTNQIILYSKNRWHIGNDRPRQLLDELFPDAYIGAAYQEEYDAYMSDEFTPSIILTFGVTFIASVFLLSYLADQLIDENSVSIIVGGKPLSIVTSVIAEGTIISLGAALLGLLIHCVLYKPVFDHVNISIGLVYRVGDYLTVFLIMAAVILVIVSLMSLKYLRLSPAKLRNRRS